jgi:hypothetical protein
MKKVKEDNDEIIEKTDSSIEPTMDEDIEIEFDDFISFANVPKKDDKGYVRGKLIKIEKTELLNKKKNIKEDDEDLTNKCFKFCFLMEGTSETIKMNRLTGTNLRPEKVYTKTKGVKQQNPEYNAFTEMCLKLEIINEKDLISKNKSILADISKIIKSTTTEKPIYIKAKLQQSTNSSKETSFETINIKSIKVIEDF